MMEKISVIFQKIARLYEQGVSKERVGAYLRRWLGWAKVGAIGGMLIGILTGCGTDRVIKMMIPAGAYAVYDGMDTKNRWYPDGKICDSHTYKPFGLNKPLVRLSLVGEDTYRLHYKCTRKSTYERILIECGGLTPEGHRQCRCSSFGTSKGCYYEWEHRTVFWGDEVRIICPTGSICLFFTGEEGIKRQINFAPEVSVEDVNKWIAN